MATAMWLAIVGAQVGEAPEYVGSNGLVFCPPELDQPLSRRTAVSPTLWPVACESAVWGTLGVPRPNQTRFQYAITAGDAETPCNHGDLLCAPAEPREPWWIAVAHGALVATATACTPPSSPRTT